MITICDYYTVELEYKFKEISIGWHTKIRNLFKMFLYGNEKNQMSLILLKIDLNYCNIILPVSKY